MLFRTASFQLAQDSAHSYARMSERDARGPEDDDKPSFILGGSVSSPVEIWRDAPQRSYSTVTLLARLRG